MYVCPGDYKQASWLLRYLRFGTSPVTVDMRTMFIMDT